MAKPRICSVDGCDKPTGVPGTGHGFCGMHYRRWKLYGDPSVTKRIANGEAISFLNRAISYRGNDCLIWPFARDEHGRGVVCVGGSVRKASRVVCERVHGSAPSRRHQGAHSCGNGHIGCVSPKHLRWATVSENQMDRAEHGTSNRGRRNHANKLNEDQVREIRSAKGSKPQAAIAADYGVTAGCIGSIFQGKTWSWLP